MNITGKLVGFDRITSKKGTDCLFAFLETPFPDNGSGVGLKIETCCAFGDDSADLADKIFKGKLLNQKVTCTGMRQGTSFITVDIKSCS